MAVQVKARRKDVEKWLDERGVTWHYVASLPLEDIDVESSLANQARLHEPVNHGVVDTYSAAMERGDEFPAIVVVRPGDNYLATVADGNHRMMAAKAAGAHTVGAYVVRGEPSSRAMITLTMEANARHGVPTSLAERLEQAAWLVAQGAPMARAAASCNVPVGSLRLRLAKERSEARALEAGIKPGQWAALSRGVRDKLATIVTDEGLKAATKLAYTANLSTGQVSELVELVNQTRSGTKQVAAVTAYASTVADRVGDSAGGVLTGKSTPKQRYTLALSNLLALPDNLGPALKKAYAPNERKGAARQARAAAAKLTALADALEA